MHTRIVLAMQLALGCALAGPCTTGTPECVERFPLGPAGRFVTIYRSYPLTAASPSIRRALIVIHGAGRNAHQYFPSAMAGAFLAGALDDTLVAAPRFAGSGAGNCKDELAPGELAFACSGSDWRGGGPAAGVDRITSYDVLDALIANLADKQRFPNLRHIVLMGHSAGGQILSRYAAASRASPEGVAIRYVVSNPSSYLYLDATRPGPTTGCPGFNEWKYGLANRTGYAASIPDEVMRQNLVRRDVVYLLGEYDQTPQFGFDNSCEAMAQGAHRLARGLAYHAYITGKYGAAHKLVKVPDCGHNGRCMMVDEQARPLLFP